MTEDRNSLFWGRSRTNRHIFGAGSLPAQKFRAFPGQPEVMVRGETLVSKEWVGADRWLVRALEDRSALVHLIKHCHVDHVGAGLFGSGELRPEKLTFEPGYFANPGIRVQVVPTETWKDDGQEVHRAFAAPSDILSVVFLGVGGSLFGAIIPAGRPWTDYIGEGEDGMQLRMALASRSSVLHPVGTPSITAQP